MCTYYINETYVTSVALVYTWNLIKPMSMNHYQKFYFVFVVLILTPEIQGQENGVRNGVSWIESPRVTSWGWRGFEDICPLGYFVKGIRLKVQEYQSPRYDDTALNGVSLSCLPLEKNPGGGVEDYLITSLEGRFGSYSYSPKEYCQRGVAIGFQLRSEPWVRQHDDTAANDMKLVCANEKMIYKTSDKGLWFGDWTTEQRCPTGTAVCGIRTQVEVYSPHADGDTSSLNNVDLLCCELPNPAQNCNATDEWKMIFKRDNSQGSTPIKYTLREKIGASHQVTNTEGGSLIEEISHNVGFGIGIELLKFLGLNFEYSIGYSTKTEYSWSRTETTTWSYEREETTELIIPPLCVTTLYQVFGTCGPYTVKANYVKRVDNCLNGNETYFYDDWFKSTSSNISPRKFYFSCALALAISILHI